MVTQSCCDCSDMQSDASIYGLISLCTASATSWTFNYVHAIWKRQIFAEHIYFDVTFDHFDIVPYSTKDKNKLYLPGATSTSIYKRP